MKTITPFAFVCAGLLAACGGATTTPGGGGGGGMIDTPRPATINAGDITRARAAISSAAALSPGIAPAVGTANYRGAMVADVTVDGGARRQMYGDVAMRAVFLPGGGLTGTINNLNITDTSGVPVEELSGALRINGSAGGIDKNVSATANGTLTGVLGDGQSGDINVRTRMDGRVLNAAGFLVVDPDEAIQGSITGSGTGSHTLTINGTYYGREQ